MALFPPFPSRVNNSGYSCQTWLGRVVNEFLHPGTYFCWFSRQFNAMANGDDSNPIWIYLILDRAVAQGGVNNAKVKDVRANLMRVVARELESGGRNGEIAAALGAISTASIEMFTPQLWKLDLSKIGTRYTGGYQYPDEYNITDLRAGEFRIIVD